MSRTPKRIYFDQSAEEEIISKHFNKFIDNEKLLLFNIPVLDRILKIYFQEDRNQDEIENVFNFLLKYLAKYKKEASVLFMNIDFNSIPNECMLLLLNEYLDIFDFSMINSQSLVQTSKEILNEFRKFEIKINYMKSETKKYFSIFLTSLIFCILLMGFIFGYQILNIHKYQKNKSKFKKRNSIKLKIKLKN